MPNSISPADRKLLLIAAGVAALFVAALLFLGSPQRGNESKVPSTYSSSSAGARAAYLLLERLNFSVQRWEESPTLLPASPQGAVYILADPTAPPSANERAALSAFVRSGGRILFCGASIDKFFSMVEMPQPTAGEDWAEVASQYPSPFTRNALTITLEPRLHWPALTAPQLALYSDASGPVAIAWRIGSGELLWWAAPTPLTNAGIARSGNLPLLLNALSDPSGRPLKVYWDEYFHGERPSLWSYVARSSVKLALYQAALLTLFALFTFSRRWGPVIPQPAPSRLSPLEFVDALGGLYQRAGVTSVPIGVAYRRLRLSLTSRLLLPSSLPDVDLARSAATRLGWNGPHLALLLNRAALAATQPVKVPVALTLVQDLESYTHRLDPQTHSTETT